MSKINPEFNFLADSVSLELTLFTQRIKQKLNCSDVEAMLIVRSIIIILSDDIDEKMTARITQMLKVIRDEREAYKSN